MRYCGVFHIGSRWIDHVDMGTKLSSIYKNVKVDLNCLSIFEFRNELRLIQVLTRLLVLRVPCSLLLKYIIEQCFHVWQVENIHC